MEIYINATKNVNESNSGVPSRKNYVTLVFMDTVGKLLPITITGVAISPTGQRKICTNY